MRQMRYYIWLSLSACMFMVAGWQATPGSPMVITLESGGFELIEDSGYTDAERDRACEPIVLFDGPAAFDLHPREQPILWTFIVNFDLLSPTGNPVGCLRLYHRMPPSGTVPSGGGTFEAIDGGGILVDTCTKGPTGTVVLSGGTAAFDAGGYVQCKMDIEAWVRDLQDHLICSPDRCDLPANNGLSLDSKLPAFVDSSVLPPYPLHGYQNFSMVAKLTEITPPHSSLLPIDVPILFYQDEAPIGFGWWWWYFNQSMTIRFQQDGGVTFPEEVGCSLPSILPPFNVPQTWWRNFLGRPSSYDWTYTYEVEAGVYPQCVTTFSTPFTTTSVLWFTIGTATLYIGNTPTSDTFKGSLDGIMIDPTDSRPPKGPG